MKVFILKNITAFMGEPNIVMLIFMRKYDNFAL